MSLRQLTLLGRRAVVHNNVISLRGPFVQGNQRAFSQGGKVFGEEEKAHENIFIKQKEAESMAKKVSEKVAEGFTPEAAKEAVHKVDQTVKAETGGYAIKDFLVPVAAIAAGGLAYWFYTQPAGKKPEH